MDLTTHAQTVDDPLNGCMLREFDERTGQPLVVNTAFGGGSRTDAIEHALECLQTGPIDLLAIGPFTVHRR
nr:carbamoyltransferase C-terminal domain-containing protein [Actinorhabdospora filicis]